MDVGTLGSALISAGTVALAEIGDKTQLLALLLAARLRKPLAIILGILIATLLNHALAGWLGTLVAHWLTPEVLRWTIAGTFFAIALWSLKPDTLDEESPASAHGALVTTIIAFFLAEIGDKTQVATVLLAAKYSPLWPVVVGTTDRDAAGERAGGAPRQPVSPIACPCAQRADRRGVVFLVLAARGSRLRGVG